MSIAQELMQYRSSLPAADEDIALMTKVAAAVIEQFEQHGSGGPEPSIGFTLEEFERLPWRWELDEGRLVFRCQRWQEENERRYPETGGYPPAPRQESNS